MTPDRQDLGAFLARLTRLDTAALVRLRRVAPDRTALWGRLPWAVLVSRTVAGAGPDDATVSAADLLKALESPGDLVLPARRDAEWRWPLPPASGRVVERLPVAELRRIAAAAAGTLRAAAAEGVGGRPVAERAVRDALLDHVAILVTTDGAHVEVPQRLVQGIARMGFLGRSDTTTAGSVNVQLAGRWIGLAAPYGIAWLLPASQFAVRPASTSTNG